MPDHFDPNAHLNEALKSAYQHAMAAAQRGKHQDALQGYKECIRIAARDRQVLPLYLLANILTNMGYCLVDLGKRQQAMSYYRQVEALLLKDTAKIQEICQHFSLTVAAFENQDLRHELGKLYDSMGLFYDTQDEWQEAIRCYQRALRIFHDLKDLQSCTLTYYYIAISYQRRQDWPNLQRAGEHLLKYALASKDAGYELQARRFLAQSAANLERFDDMVNQLESAVSLGRKLGDPKVAIDEKLLESARQQTRNGRASAPGQSSRQNLTAASSPINWLMRSAFKSCPKAAIPSPLSSCTHHTSMRPRNYCVLSIFICCLSVWNNCVSCRCLLER